MLSTEESKQHRGRGLTMIAMFPWDDCDEEFPIQYQEDAFKAAMELCHRLNGTPLPDYREQVKLAKERVKEVKERLVKELSNAIDDTFKGNYCWDDTYEAQQIFDFINKMGTGDDMIYVYYPWN